MPEKRKSALGGRIFTQKDAAALDNALNQLGITVRYNLRACRAEMSRPGKDWEPLDDLAMASVVAAVADTFFYETKARQISPLHYGRQHWQQAIDALLYDRKVDPFLQWLEALPSWDGTPRLDGWLGEVFTLDKTHDPALAEWVSRSLFYGIVYRTYEPGAKFDEIPVLIGPQGIGKSTVLALLVPPEIPGLFNDDLNLAGDSKARAEALQGRALVEASELAGLRRADLEALKAFASRQDDGGHRAAYRRNPEPRPRRCIIVGTSNHLECLPNDPAGNRRFVPIRLAGGDVSRVGVFLDRARKQLWAQAVALYKMHKVEPENVPPPWLGGPLKAAQRAAAESARRCDEVVEAALEGAEKDLLVKMTGGPFQLNELIESADLKTHPGINYIAADYLQRRGYHKGRQDSKRVWFPVDA